MIWPVTKLASSGRDADDFDSGVGHDDVYFPKSLPSLDNERFDLRDAGEVSFYRNGFAASKFWSPIHGKERANAIR
jgi:hypothetical protein